jgi:hypothetical protein
MQYTIKDLDNFLDIKSIWDSIADNTTNAWFWSTYAQYCFRITVLKSAGNFIADDSFVLLKDGEPCGLAPLIFVKAISYNGIQAGYDMPLPFPMIIDSVGNYSETLDYVFDEIEKRCKANNIGMIKFIFSPPCTDTTSSKFISELIFQRNFVDCSINSHCMEISSSTLHSVRKRYIRYVKKFQPKYQLTMLDANNCYEDLAKEYMALHVKDSGKQNRPLATYEGQISLIKNKEAVMVQAKNIQDNKIVGMLIVSIYKKSAFDNSVAVDPDYTNHYISHLMKWKIIQYLHNENILSYELGPSAEMPNYLLQPNKKNYGISHFKQGWSRDGMKKVFIIEKYYSKEAFQQVWLRKSESILKYFDIA